MRGVGGGVGGPPLRDHLWQGPPLPVTLRLIHPPAFERGRKRCWHSNACFRYFLRYFSRLPSNKFSRFRRAFHWFRSCWLCYFRYQYKYDLCLSPERDALDQLLLPDTVQAVIRARLDRLDKGAKEVIGPASVIGRVFSERVLASVYSGRSPLAEALEVLPAQEIVQQTKILPELEYSFRHLLTREVAYDTLLHQQRKQLHEAVGMAIERLYPTRTEENASILVHHYSRSRRADKTVQYAL